MRSRLAVLAFALLACGDGTAPPERSLEQAERQWRALGASNYDYVLTFDCFCVVTGPLRVEVRNNHLVQVVKTTTGEVLTTPFWGYTVELLHSLIRHEMEAGRLNEATYDGRGIPTKISTGTLENDAGLVIWTSNFVKR
jgi:hypothetical protein